MFFAAVVFLAAGASAVVTPIESPCNATVKDIAAGTEYNVHNSTDDTTGACLRTFTHVADTHAVMECLDVNPGLNIFLSSVGLFDGKAQLHGHGFEGKIAGELASNPHKDVTVTSSAPIALPTLPEGHGTGHEPHELIQHTEYNCVVKVVPASSDVVKNIPTSCDDLAKVYEVKSGEAYELNNAVLAKCPLKFALPNEVRPTISCESFNLGEKVSLALYSTGVVPRQGLPFFGTQLEGKIFGYLPQAKNLPARNWTLELEADEGGNKDKAVMTCLLGGDLFVNK